MSCRGLKVDMLVIPWLNILIFRLLVVDLLFLAWVEEEDYYLNAQIKVKNVQSV